MKTMFLKTSDGEGALPQISVSATPASDKNTLAGMVPPAAYTRVNASTPPVADAGAVQQKSIAPMGAQALSKMAQVFSCEDGTMNMTPRLRVQDLVKQAMANAAQRAHIAEEGARQMKLASETCEKCRGKDNCSCDEEEKKTASDISSIPTEYAHKLAAAIEYAAPAVVKMASSAAHITENIAHAPEGVSASNQPGSPPGPGQQGHGHHQPPHNPGTQKGLPQEHGTTQLENTLHHHVPGTQTTAMSGGQGKTASLVERNLKVAFSISDAGHRLDKATAEAARDAASRRIEAREKYKKDSPGGAAAATMTVDALGGKGVGHFSGISDLMRERHNDYVAREHATGHNALNPFGGILTKTKAEKEREKRAFSVTDAGHKYDAERFRADAEQAGKRREARSAYSKEAPLLAHLGGQHVNEISDLIKERHANYAAKEHASGHNAYNPFGGLLTKTDREKKAHLVDGLLSYVKEAEDAINPAQISAGPAVPPDTNASGEPGGAPVGGLPQGPRGLVGSNESAINYKKQTAYSPRKSELAAYFNEPALSAATDKTLNQAFAHTGEAGVKISSAQLVKSAAARALLSKLAEESEAKASEDSKKDDKKNKKDKQSGSYC